MVRTLVAAFVVLAGLAMLGSAQEPGAPPPPAEREPLWRRCYQQVKWFHAAEVPNMEPRLLELAQKPNGLLDWSKQWIAEAIAAAPSLDACKAEGKKQNKLLLWYIPSAEGQHLILPHLLDRYVMTGALGDPYVVRALNAAFVSVKLPVGGALAAATQTGAPAFIEPGVIIFAPDGTELHRVDRIGNFDAGWWLSMLAAVVQQHGEGLAGSTEVHAAQAAMQQRPLIAGTVAEALEALAPKSEEPEALHDYGMALHLSQRDAEARQVWTRCITKFPDSPWAALSSAHAVKGTDGLWGESAFVRGVSDPRAMHADAYRLQRDTQWRRTPADVADIKQRALEWLLRHQREDGSWSGPRWGGPKKDLVDLHNLRMPIAALCCLALRAHRRLAPERVDAALLRGEGYLLRTENDIARGDRVAWVYGDAYRLLYFGGDRRARRRPAIKKRIARWLKHLREHQVAIGGSYKHYSYRSTFVTAEMIRVLAAVKKHGVKVPDVMLTEAGAKLATTRDPNGVLYGYLLDHPHVTRDVTGASSRQPLCDHAMVLSGAATIELSRSIAVYQRGYPNTVSLLRKTNFHSPKVGNVAGYYFFHNFRAACDVAGAHGTAQQKQWMLGALCALPEIDGSFTDSGFSYGKCYGTAQALLCFAALEKKH